jgi:hypothetical protein
LKKFLFILSSFFLISGCGPSAPTFTGPTLHLLFIGNSYTFVNNLPTRFAELAASGHHQVITDLSAPGGETLLQHSTNPETLSKLKGGKWDFVILQDQSYLPALDAGRERELDPGVRLLSEMIRGAGAKPLLYLTWGRQKGLPDQGFSDFDSMQTQLTKGYLDIAQELKIPLVPAGEAWRTALSHDASAALWGSDGSHPSVEGVYLTACVFYAAIYQTTPVGLAYTAGLSADQAKAMQTAAAETVLADPGKWNAQ